MECCISNSQYNDEGVLTGVPERPTKHSHKRKPAKRLQTRSTKRKETGSRVKVEGRFDKKKAVTEHTQTRNTKRKETGSRVKVEGRFDKKKAVTEHTTSWDLTLKDSDVAGLDRSIPFEKNELVDKNCWESTFEIEGSGQLISYFNGDLSLYECIESVGIPRSPINPAFDPMQFIDVSEINEQAKPCVNIAPDAPPPPVLQA